MEKIVNTHTHALVHLDRLPFLSVDAINRVISHKTKPNVSPYKSIKLHKIPIHTGLPVLPSLIPTGSRRGERAPPWNGGGGR